MKNTICAKTKQKHTFTKSLLLFQSVHQVNCCNKQQLGHGFIDSQTIYTICDSCDNNFTYKYQPKTCCSNTVFSSSSDRKAHSSPTQPAEAIRVASYVHTHRQPDRLSVTYCQNDTEAENHLFRKPHPLCLTSVFLL